MANKTPDYAREYRNQVNRILRFWKRAEARGFEFKKSGIINDVKKPNKRSVERLRKYTAAELYKKALYHNPDTGEIMTAEEGRHYEASKAAKKAAATRKRFMQNRGWEVGNGKPPREDEVSLDNLIDEISSWSGGVSEEDRSLLNEILEKAKEAEGGWRIGYNAWFNTKMQTNGKMIRILLEHAINNHGIHNLIRIINRNANEIRAILNTILDSKQQTGTTAEQHLAGLASILWGESLTGQQASDIEDFYEVLHFNTLMDDE